MQCGNHPEETAADRCAGCAELFCRKCLVPLGGQAYCGSCKILPTKNLPALEETTRRCPEAADALKLALIGGLLFFIWIGPLLGVLAITKGAAARKAIADNPLLTGSGLATAGIIIGSADAIVGILIFIASQK